jgi:hypothetical protein
MTGSSTSPYDVDPWFRRDGRKPQADDRTAATFPSSFLWRDLPAHVVK